MHGIAVMFALIKRHTSIKDLNVFLANHNS